MGHAALPGYELTHGSERIGMNARAQTLGYPSMLNSWLRQEGFEVLGAEQILEAPDLEHAVARGAAYYGMVRRGRGVRIRSGASRTY
jgi:hypothetical protein